VIGFKQDECYPDKSGRHCESEGQKRGEQFFIGRGERGVLYMTDG
jgi:hypothetical protein